MARKLHPEPGSPRSPIHIDHGDHDHVLTLAEHRRLSNQGPPIAVRCEGGARGMMGKCYRSPIWGTPTIKNVNVFTDFCVLDLWERKEIFGDLETLAQDPYTFKIVPLQLRTWIYHEIFDSRDSAKSKSENALIESVLSYKVHDCECVAGRWSPALCIIPVTIFAAVFAADFGTAFACVCSSLFNVTASQFTNTPFYFGYSRPITIIPRIGFFVFMVLRMATQAERGGQVILAFLVILGALCTDFILGDCAYVRGWGSRCRYEVVKCLPNRIFICRKHGAAFVPDPENGREIPSFVTGVRHSDEICVIAEVRGLVVQLKPMDIEDWKLAVEELADTNRPVSFLGLDVFNRERKTIQDIDLSLKADTQDGAHELLVSKLAKSKGSVEEQPGLPEVARRTSSYEDNVHGNKNPRDFGKIVLEAARAEKKKDEQSRNFMGAPSKEPELLE